MKKFADAEYLARLMVETGNRMGKKVVALITSMDQPLGRTAGNAMEVAECIEVLNGAGPADTRELSLELAAWMLHLGGRVANIADGKLLAQEMIASGRARDTFREIIRLQKGDPRVVDDPARLPRASHKLDVTSASAGHLAEINCERVGTACVILGGGREKKEDSIDPAVGLEFHKRLGDRVERGTPLVTVHYNSGARLAEARAMLEAAYVVAEKAEPAKPLVQKVIS